jgi:REP element-mobilizing transposase RayT
MTEHRHLPHISSFRDNPIVFFTTCTHRRRNLLACAQSHIILRALWERSAERDGWWVGHYILMPDHAHFFARRTIVARPMASWMQMWKSVSSRQLSAALDIAIPIWQPDYFDRYLRSRENYSQKWNYVEQNAVRAGLVKEASEWIFRGTINDLMW